MTRLPSVEVATTIAAGPARVWAIVSDIAVLPAFTAELQSVEWVGERRGPALGASFDGVNTHPAMGDVDDALDHRRIRSTDAIGLGGRRSRQSRGDVALPADRAPRRLAAAVPRGDRAGTLGSDDADRPRPDPARFRYRPPPQGVSRQYDSHSVRDQGAGRRQRPRRCVGTPRAAAVPVTGRRPNRLCRPFRVVGSTADRVAS